MEIFTESERNVLHEFFSEALKRVSTYNVTSDNVAPDYKITKYCNRCGGAMNVWKCMENKKNTCVTCRKKYKKQIEKELQLKYSDELSDGYVARKLRRSAGIKAGILPIKNIPPNLLEEYRESIKLKRLIKNKNENYN